MGTGCLGLLAYSRLKVEEFIKVLGKDKSMHCKEILGFLCPLQFMIVNIDYLVMFIT